MRSAPFARGFDSRMCLGDIGGILHIRIRVLYLLNRSFHAHSRRTVLPGVPGRTVLPAGVQYKKDWWISSKGLHFNLFVHIARPEPL